MSKVSALTHEFVEFMPDNLEDGRLYISIGYATVAHKCCCGCGKEVVTPLSPTDWKLIFDGKTVSLDPSIGNWSFACQSHYWIRNNNVKWAARWTKEEIERARTHDQYAKQTYFETPDATLDTVAKDDAATEAGPKRRSFWRGLKWWS